MEKNQYELCIDVLRRLNNKNGLKDIILIGSWCMPFYKEYFNKKMLFFCFFLASHEKCGILWIIRFGEELIEGGL